MEIPTPDEFLGFRQFPRVSTIVLHKIETCIKLLGGLGKGGLKKFAYNMGTALPTVHAWRREPYRVSAVNVDKLDDLYRDLTQKKIQDATKKWLMKNRKKL